ncbi:MAG: dipeptidase [Acidobacteria bacterium]|nr:dipeptidase [Acidobacteriota bacterium]
MIIDPVLGGLISFLRIPSVSTDPAHAGDVRQAAEFVVNELLKAGFANARLVEAEGRHPLVRAEWLHALGAPTLIVYGHYDVQPPDPLDEWISPPFEPEVRDGNIYARGASDDKGQTYILLQALARLMREDGRLPVNIKVLIEGEEEVGGEHITEHVATHAGEFQADAALICDTEMFAPDLPTICTGLRGIVYGELLVEGARTDLHSGVYGGAAPNPIQAAAQILSELKDREGRIRIPGFLDRVKPPSPGERAAWARLPFNEQEYLDREIGAPALVGDPAIPVLERTWAQPTLEVHGIRGGFTGEGAKTVIPAKALAKVSMRLVADQDPDEATRQLQAAVAAACPPGVRARFTPIQSGPPSLIDPENPFIRAGAQALEETFGVKTVYMRSGGSIPIVGLFQKHLAIPSVLIGFGLPDDNLHAPNEKFNLSNFYRGIDAIIKYLRLLGVSSIL